MSGIHQRSEKTWYNRYPEIFRACAGLVQGRIRALSFGCSDGSEVSALRDLYFQDAEIHGVDINPRCLDACGRLEDERTSFSEAPLGMYDLVFCMSVLCRWGIMDGLPPYAFNEFDDQLIELDEHLGVGGFLVVYNAGFRFSDSTVYNRYEPVGEFEDSGFVPKYDLHGDQVFGYKHVIFKKNR